VYAHNLPLQAYDFFSKVALVNRTKISTNENSRYTVGDCENHVGDYHRQSLQLDQSDHSICYNYYLNLQIVPFWCGQRPDKSIALPLVHVRVVISSLLNFGEYPQDFRTTWVTSPYQTLPIFVKGRCRETIAIAIIVTFMASHCVAILCYKSLTKKLLALLTILVSNLIRLYVNV
jgi:hypothetical protein